MQDGAAGDFLKKGAETPLCAHFFMAGVNVRIETNTEPILQIARECFGQPQPTYAGHEEINVRLWVEDSSQVETPRPKPFFRGLGGLVFAGFDGRNSLLINLRSRRVLGRLTSPLATDATFWKTVLFPSFLTIVGPSVGLVPLHCACVAWKGSGLLLAGASGSGKSTLSLALSQVGFDFLSDDRTLVSDRQGRLLAWSVFTETKLCADAVAHFPDLKKLQASEIWKGQPVFRFDPAESFGLSRIHCCEPRWLIFLEQEPSPTFSLNRIAPEEAEGLLQEDLHQETPEVFTRECRTIGRIVERECYKFHYGGNPHTVAGALRCLVAEGLKPSRVSISSRPQKQVSIAVAGPDPLRRFRPTPLGSDLFLMGRRIRLETNSPLVLKNVNQMFNHSDRDLSNGQQFLWRIACEPGEGSTAHWPKMAAFSGEEVRYVNLGHRSFIAVDLPAREAVGILPENLVEDEPGFSSVFLAAMFYLTAAALGLTPVSAACVAQNNEGVLLIGPPKSGKTTSSYCAKKLGLEFHSDQGTFLELDGGILRAWGDFWPAAFRPESAKFIPELSELARPFHCWDRTFLCVEKSSPSSCPVRDVTPVACVFLDKQPGVSPKLIPLPTHGRADHLLPKEPFKDDAGAKSQREAVRKALRGLPSYRLLYGDDPWGAAFFIRSVLSTHHLLEARS
ncbi:MAG: hypothetical protein LAP13_23555 [Acidobacteriia bacterium]|nr:hypothetical protein [Terriglobia bacterium]